MLLKSKLNIILEYNMDHKNVINFVSRVGNCVNENLMSTYILI